MAVAMAGGSPLISELAMTIPIGPMMSEFLALTIHGFSPVAPKSAPAFIMDKGCSAIGADGAKAATRMTLL